MRVRFIAIAAAAALNVAAFGGTYDYAVWTSTGSSTASGTMGGVGVTYSGPYLSVLTNYAGGYYDNSPSDYTSATVSNAPATTDNFIQLTGGNSATYSLTFSQPVNNLVISVLSLGAGGTSASFNFNTPFTLLSQGTDQWGGSNTSLTVSGNNLNGTEGSGSILFPGQTSSLTWTLPSYENWYGMTAAAATPEPCPLAIVAIGGLGLLVRRKKRS